MGRGLGFNGFVGIVFVFAVVCSRTWSLICGGR